MTKKDKLGHEYYKTKVFWGLFGTQLTCKNCGWHKRVNDNYQTKCEGTR